MASKVHSVQESGNTLSSGCADFQKRPCWSLSSLKLSPKTCFQQKSFKYSRVYRAQTETHKILTQCKTIHPEIFGGEFIFKAFRMETTGLNDRGVCAERDNLPSPECRLLIQCVCSVRICSRVCVRSRQKLSFADLEMNIFL